MRAVNVFLFFILVMIVTPAYSEEANRYFLKPSDPTGNSLTEYFRNHTVKIHDSVPCQDRVFFSHLATPAATLPGNRFAYEPFPGARFDGLLMNSLSVGLWTGMQIGFVPLFYIGSSSENEDGSKVEHQGNFNFKWNLLSYEKWDIALAYSTIRFKNTFATPLVLPGGLYTDTDISYTWMTLVINYFFDNIPLALGVNFSSVSLSSQTEEMNAIFEKQNTSSESIFDMNYIINPSWAVTGSIGKMKETAFELEDAYTGFGATVTYVRNKKWFNQISLGVHHFNTINTDKILFSFSI